MGARVNGERVLALLTSETRKTRVSVSFHKESNLLGLTKQEADAIRRAAERVLGMWAVGVGEFPEPHGATMCGDLLAIHVGLRHRFTDPDRACAWIRRPNAAFGGMSALEKMRESGGILAVRKYLATEDPAPGA